MCYRDFHLTLDVLLHYLAKSENPIYSCFKNNPFLFSFFLKRQSFAIKILSKQYLFIIYIFFANTDVTRYAIVFVKYCINVLYNRRRQQKLYGATKILIMFPNKNWTLSGVKTVLSKTDATGSVERCSGSGRPRAGRRRDTITDMAAEQSVLNPIQ